jgi:hypothetical protein
LEQQAALYHQRPEAQTQPELGHAQPAPRRPAQVRRDRRWQSRWPALPLRPLEPLREAVAAVVGALVRELRCLAVLPRSHCQTQRAKAPLVLFPLPIRLEQPEQPVPD